MKTVCVVLITMMLSHGVRGDAVVEAPFPRNPVGDTVDVYPFLIKQAGFTSMRYQQVYAASAFMALDPGGENITRIAFYPDNEDPNRDYSWSIPSIQISFSTTTQAVDSLSPIFASNVGVDDQIVYGPVPVSYVGGIGTSLVFNLSQPFFYNPARGNLLMDVRVFDGSGPYDFNNPYFDAQLSAGDAVSRVYAADVNASIGELGTYGLRTGFLTVSIPEPASVWLCSVGLAALALLRQRSERS